MIFSDKNKTRKALLLGATGMVGDCLLGQLLESGLYAQVITVSRRPLSVEHPILISEVIDFSCIEEVVTGLVVNDVYCCLGTTKKQAGSKQAFRRVDLDYPLKVARIARNWAEHFLLVSAVGANVKSGLFYNRVKGELEQEVLAMGFPFTTIVRPSLLIGKRNNARRLENAGIRLITAMKPFLAGPLRNYAGVNVEDVASALLQQAFYVADEKRSQTTLVLESAMMQK